MIDWLKRALSDRAAPETAAPRPTLSVSDSLIADMRANADPSAAQKAKVFHKTGLESRDIFLGVQKTLVKKLATDRSAAATFHDIKRLLARDEHEIKLAAIYILIEKGRNPQTAKESYRFLFDHLHALTSWDLVDLVAPVVIGEYLGSRPHLPRDDLYRLMQSHNDWDKRIALQAARAFVENKEFEDALKLCRLALKESSTMVQTTAGKLLHDIGGRNRHILIEFLAQHQTRMASAMLSAATKDMPQLRKTIRKETRILAGK